MGGVKVEQTTTVNPLTSVRTTPMPVYRPRRGAEPVDPRGTRVVHLPSSPSGSLDSRGRETLGIGTFSKTLNLVESLDGDWDRPGTPFVFSVPTPTVQP